MGTSGTARGNLSAWLLGQKRATASSPGATPAANAAWRLLAGGSRERLGPKHLV